MRNTLIPGDAVYVRNNIGMLGLTIGSRYRLSEVSYLGKDRVYVFSVNGSGSAPTFLADKFDAVIASGKVEIVEYGDNELTSNEKQVLEAYRGRSLREHNGYIEEYKEGSWISTIEISAGKDIAEDIIRQQQEDFFRNIGVL